MAVAVSQACAGVNSDDNALPHLSMARCRWVCQWMRGAAGVEHFATPVDWRGLQLHDYPSIVTTPMDLERLQASVENDDDDEFDYDAFKATASLIWSNTRLYNGPDHPISQLADRLERLMHEKLQQCELHPTDDVDVHRTATIMLPLVNALHLTNRFAIFDEAVDVEAEPNYLLLIDRPVCLTDIMKGIEDLSYVSVHDILSDIGRIVTNAKTYNDASNPVHSLATDLELTTLRLATLRLPDMHTPYFVSGEMRMELSNKSIALSDARRLQLASLLRTICPDAIEHVDSEVCAFIFDALCLEQFMRVDSMLRAWLFEDTT